MAKRCKKTSDLWGELKFDSRLNRSKFAITVENDQYVILAGGYGANSLSVVVLDLINCTAFQLPGLPIEDYHGSCVGTILNGNLYLISRYGECPVYRLNLTAKEFESNQRQFLWQKVDGSNRHYGETVISNETNLFLFSDHGNEAYIPQTNSWVPLPYMSNPRWDHASTVCENKVYVIGGYDDTKFMPTSSVEVYDIMKRNWSPSVPLPVCLYGSSAVVVADRFILVTGGENKDEKRVKDCFVFDIERQEWFNTSPVRLTVPRSNHGSVLVNNGRKLMIVGGVIKRENPNNNIPLNECINVAKMINWHIVKCPLLLRHLVEKGRAHIRDSNCRKEEMIIQKTIATLGLDIFRNVLSFLIVSE